jgi:hypothetical protein
MLKQALAQVREVSIWVSVGGRSLVDLIHMHAIPGDLLVCERPQHNPGSVTATDSEKEVATGSDGRTCIRGDCGRCGSGDGIGIIKDFKRHELSSNGINLTTRTSDAKTSRHRLCNTSLVNWLRQRGNLPGPWQRGYATHQEATLSGRSHSAPRRLSRIRRREC